jgi:hypothetical protein
MDEGEEEREEMKNQKRDDSDPSSLSDKDSLTDSSIPTNKLVNSIHSSFLWTAGLTILLPILWFIVTTAMVEGNNNLWWVRLIGSDNIGDASKGRGITMLLGFGWTLGLFFVYIYQGNIILRVICKSLKSETSRKWSCCASKRTAHATIDDRKIGMLVGSLYTFSNFCLVLFLLVAWPAVRLE